MKLARVELERVTFAQLLGAGCLSGIGFTMSIFISELAFTDVSIIDQAKVGILVASVVAGALGALILNITLPKEAS